MLLLLLLVLVSARPYTVEYSDDYDSQNDYDNHDHNDMAYTQAQQMAAWRAFAQTEDFREVIMTVLKREQMVQIYSDKILTALENPLKEKAKTKLTKAFEEMKEDLRRQVVESATKTLTGSVDRIKLDMVDFISVKTKEFISGSETIRGYLQQHEVEVNAKMNKVFEDSKLQLENLYHQHLVRIIEEDQYRTINAALIDDLKNSYRREFEALVQDTRDAFSKSYAEWSGTINNVLVDISAKTSQVSETHRLLQEMQTRLENTEKASKLAMTLSGIAIGLLAIRIALGFCR